MVTNLLVTYLFGGYSIITLSQNAPNLPRYFDETNEKSGNYCK